MQFSSILTSIALASVMMLSPSLSAKAQNTDTARLDDVVLDMDQSYKVRDRKRMAQLLPTLRGHALEPWAAALARTLPTTAAHGGSSTHRERPLQAQVLGRDPFRRARPASGHRAAAP